MYYYLLIDNKKILKIKVRNIWHTDLTFDWIENRLGWIEVGSRIKTYNIKIGTSDLIYSNFQNLSSLTIDAHNRYVEVFLNQKDQYFG